jgi:hypothetical protein
MIVADIYKPELWTGFFVLVETGAVTLTGLVFVAMSLNLKVIATDATHRYRAIGTLTGLAAVFLRCALVLMADQNHQAVGAELLIVSGAAAVVFVNGYVQAYRSGSAPSLFRTVGGTCLYLAEMVGATMFILGSIFGLYVAATALVINTCYMISGAWLLVVGVYEGETKKIRS